MKKLFILLLQLALFVSAAQYKTQLKNQNDIKNNHSINNHFLQNKVQFTSSQLNEDSDSCYSVVFDAGSTGTKYEVFKWNCDQAFNQDQRVIIQSIKQSKDSQPISNYESSLQDLSSVFEQKFIEIREVIPEQKLNETDLYLGATQGMRLLKQEKQEAIINQIIQIFQGSGFRFQDSSKVSVITGEQEGIFMWIAINSMIEQISQIQDIYNKDTITTIDLGGKSAQITYLKTQEEFNENDANFEYQLASESKFTFLVNSEKLGFKHARIEILKHEFENQQEKGVEKILYSSCHNQGYEGYDEELNFKIVGKGNPKKCINLIRQFMKLENCDYPEFKDCSQDTSLQQKVLQVSKDQKIYMVENAMYARKAYGLNDSYTPQQLRKKAIQFCKKNYSQIVEKDDYTPDLCLKGLYVSSLQIDHYGIDSQQIIYSPSEINQWVPSWGIGMLFTEIFYKKCNLYNSQSQCGSLQSLLENQ